MSRSPSPEPPFISARSEGDDKATVIDSLYGPVKPYYSSRPISQVETSRHMDIMYRNIEEKDMGRAQAERQESSADRYPPVPEPVEPAKYGFSGTIQQQPTPARVFTAADLSKMKTTGNFGYILKRAVKRSSKSAVLKQLAAFARKNKKHANKCLLYKEYIRCI